MCRLTYQLDSQAASSAPQPVPLTKAKLDQAYLELCPHQSHGTSNHGITIIAIHLSSKNWQDKLDASFNSLSLPPLAPSQAMHVATVKSSKACCRCSDQLGSLNYAYKGHTRIKVAVMCKYLAFINRNLSVCRGASSARNLAQQTTCWSSVMLRDHDFWSFLRALCFPTKSLHRTQSRIEGNIFVIVIHFLH